MKKNREMAKAPRIVFELGEKPHSHSLQLQKYALILISSEAVKFIIKIPLIRPS